MKLFLLSLFVAAAFAAPAPLDEENGDVELIVNGVAEGEPLELGDVLGIKIKEHADGEVVSATDLLHPLTAAGLAEAAAADIPEPIEVVQLPEIVEIKPDPVELPPPAIPGGAPLPPINIPVLLPESMDVAPPAVPGGAPLPPINIPALLPESIDVPELSVPEVFPESIFLPQPVLPEAPVVPEPIELPEPVLPEVEAPAEAAPEQPAPEIPTGEVFNNGVVQVTLNAPESGVMSTVQSWFNMVLNYFNGNVVTTQQIV